MTMAGATRVLTGEPGVLSVTVSVRIEWVRTGGGGGTFLPLFPPGDKFVCSAKEGSLGVLTCNGPAMPRIEDDGLGITEGLADFGDCEIWGVS